MSFSRLTLIAFCASVFAFAGCGGGDPVQNFNNSPIVASGAKKNMQDVKRGIILAGSRIGWQMQQVKPGTMYATIFKRGSMAKVEINYTADTYSITYKDSSNLKYDGNVIHGTYNKWVTHLHRNIRDTLSKM